MQAMGGALVGAPRVVTEDTRVMMAFNGDAGLGERIGSRVLPDFLSIADNPSIRDYHGKPLFAGYQVDEDGVKTGSTTLIDQGVLKTLLHTRGLIPGTEHSTANRRGFGTMPSNLIFTSTKSMTSDQLKAELLKVVKQRNKEYGIIVRRMGDQVLAQNMLRSRVIIFTSGAPQAIEVEPLIEAYKVFPDGHEELVRNLTVNGLSMGAFKDILAVSDTPSVETRPFRQKIFSPATGGIQSIPGPNLVSVAIPSLLFDELTLQRPKGDIPNLLRSPGIPRSTSSRWCRLFDSDPEHRPVRSHGSLRISRTLRYAPEGTSLRVCRDPEGHAISTLSTRVLGPNPKWTAGSLEQPNPLDVVT